MDFFGLIFFFCNLHLLKMSMRNALPKFVKTFVKNVCEKCQCTLLLRLLKLISIVLRNTMQMF